MKPFARLCFVPALLFVWAPFTSLFAETEVRAIYGQSTGIYIWEFANIMYGFPGASKLSYGHNVPYYGIEGIIRLDRWDFTGRYQSTDRGNNTQHVRDEDFYCFPGYAQRRGPRVEILNGSFRDQPDTYTGVSDAINSNGEADLREYQVRGGVFYSLTPSWSLGAQGLYTHNSYNWKRSIQETYIWRPEPIYGAIRFSSNFYELQTGLRFTEKAGAFQFGLQFLPGVGAILTHDWHVLRNMAWRESRNGFSLYSSLMVGYKTERVTVTASAWGRRLYARNGYQDAPATEPMIGVQIRVNKPSDLNFKENGYEFGIGYAF